MLRFYCINLEKNITRWHESKIEFKKAGIRVKKIKGINEPENPAMGCTLSHMKILQEAKKNKYEMVGVFEDDIYFYQPEMCIEKIQNMIQILPNNWRILYLGGLIGRNAKIQKISDEIYKVDHMMCTYGIIYNSTSYDEILMGLNQKKIGGASNIAQIGISPPHKTYDNWLAWEYQTKFPCFVTNPFLVAERPNYSDIEKKYKKVAKKYAFRFWMYTKGMGWLMILIGSIGDFFGFSERKKFEKSSK